VPCPLSLGSALPSFLSSPASSNFKINVRFSSCPIFKINKDFALASYCKRRNEKQLDALLFFFL
ncbi:hypothetical protein, partial [Enterovibrio norvegicus]|uniref:hypothetical protein n=1 Tax=Enterovibrio norvegicus TaxID=188144 RepID=UPI001E41B450